MEALNDQMLMAKVKQMWSNSRYRTRDVFGVNNAIGDYKMSIYDFRKLIRAQFRMYLMENKHNGTRTVKVELCGSGAGEQFEHNFWLNPFKMVKRVRNGKVSKYTWTKVNSTPSELKANKPRGVQAAFKCTDSYPELQNDTYELWLSSFKAKLDETFGKNTYTVAAFGAEPFNRTAIPYAGIGLSDMGSGSEFLLRLGEFEVKGQWEHFESWDINDFSFSEDSACLCVGFFSNVISPFEHEYVSQCNEFFLKT